MNRMVIVAFLALGILRPVAGADLSGNVYTVGIVPQFEVRELHSIWRPVLDYLEKETGYQFKLRGSLSIPSFEREFSRGKFDFAYMNPYHFVIANDDAGYIPLVRDHSRRLHGVLVVRTDSGITDPGQLAGKTLAFPAPNALGASLQIRQELRDKYGIKFKSSYVKTHDSVYLNVLLGEADAGGGVQKTLKRQNIEYRDMLRVIHKTQDVAPHPLAVLPSVPTEVRERVRDALLKMGQTEQGKKLLSRIPIDKIGPASIDDYRPLKELGLERFYVSPSANPSE